MELKILSGADEDIRREFSRFLQYNKGEKFYNLLDQQLELLKSFPRMGRVFSGNYRRLIITEFQLGVYYEAQPTALLLNAVLPLKIHPAVLKHRLGV